jgi:hypothetical protein
MFASKAITDIPFAAAELFVGNCGCAPSKAASYLIQVENSLLRFLTLLLAIVAFLMAAAAQEIAAPQETQNLPEGQGVFCRTGGSKWTKLEPATVAGMRTEGMKRFVETAGLSTIYTTIAYKGTESSVRVSDARPVFFVRGAGSAQDALIVRLNKKKDNRETYTSSDNTSYDNKRGYKTSDICRLLITAYSRDAFSATPEEALNSGEYLITFGDINVGYDFAVVIRAE